MKKLFALILAFASATTFPAVAIDGGAFAAGTLFGFGTGALTTAIGSRHSHCHRHCCPKTTEYYYPVRETRYIEPVRKTRYVEVESNISHKNRKLKREKRQLEELDNQLEAQLSRSKRKNRDLELENTHLEARVARLERALAQQA